MKTIDVLYVLATGHSGSTLLDLLLGSHTKIEGVGEICHLSNYFSPTPLSRGRHAGLCTCGKAVTDCEFWQSVRAELAREHGTPDININSTRRAGLARANRNLFEAISTVSGKDILCDSSKSMKRLLLLANTTGLSVHVIHLIRDGRAVAYSSLTKRNRLLSRAFCWQRNLLHALQLRLLSRRPNVQVSRVKYEELATHPAETLERILQRNGLHFEKNQLRFSELSHHNLGGNRMRWKKGQGITLSREYLDKLTTRDWIATTVISLFGLCWFGYPLRRPERRVEPARLDLP